MLIGFFTFARRSNLVPSSAAAFDPKKQLQRADIIAGSDRMFVIFKWSKTIQFGERALVMPLVALPNTKICPLAAYERLVRSSPGSPNDPAFATLRRGKLVAISQGKLQETIKSLVKKIDGDPTNFSSHSLRRGGASWASRCGCSADQIKLFGDWHSDCYEIYIENSLEQRTVVASKMAQCIVQQHTDKSGP